MTAAGVAGVAWRAGGSAGKIAEAHSTTGPPRSGQLLGLDGLTPYPVAFELMHSLADERLRGEASDTLILCEHPPVYTAGRRFRPEHVVWTEAQIRDVGAELHLIDRGG